MLKSVKPLVAVVILWSQLLFLGVASAAPPKGVSVVCLKYDFVSMRCLLEAQVSEGSGAGGSSGTWVCRNRAGQVIDCETELGVWYHGSDCYVAALEPQPVHDDPQFLADWAGMTSGALYHCRGGFKPGEQRPGWSSIIWLPEPPKRNPLELVYRALAQLDLRAIDIGIVPLSTEKNPNAIGLVGRPVWMWVESPDADSIGPKSVTVSVASHPVGLNARVSEIVWDMGNGDTVTCSGPGTKWSAARAAGNAKSPTCGYVYSKEGTYTVTATSYWQVDWNALGSSGQITFSLERNTQIQVGELQVVSVAR